MFNLFPQGLEGTLVVPILLGVLVMAAFTEAWGWDFVGVVVPGYLASVALLAPVVAGTVLVEAVFTWGLAVALDRGLLRARLAYPVFGRDRFFLVLAVSVAVRLTLEAFVFQALAARLGGGWLERRRELFGVGLVLVPLVANRLWSPGLRRGMFQLLVQAALVAAALRFVLLPFTNFALAGFDPTYDPLALAFLTSPRPQMALLVTAALASAWNRRYGWDYHGILVPALLGLAVLSPVKLLATLVEALFILVGARLVLQLPRLRTASVEGARRVVLCFAVGVVFKMVAARVALAELPGYRPTDLLGFGYLLPSLLAERIWLKQRLVPVFLPTVQTAVVGFVLTALSATGLAVVAPVAAPTPTVFPSLPQLVAAWHRQALVAETADGYRVKADERRLVATRAGTSQTVEAPVDSAAAAAITATRQGRGLILDQTPWSPPPPRPTSSVPQGWQALARRAAAEVVAASEPVRVLAPEAGLALDRNRDRLDPVLLAPYGIGLTSARDASVLSGEGWPLVVLRPGATAVVAAAHATEVGSAGSAVEACALLSADCVIPRDDGAAAVGLAAALAQHRGRPLLVVRGTSRALGADALVVTTPSPPEAAPGWARPVLDAFAGRLSWTGRADATLGELRAFPPGAGTLGATVLLWLSPFARRVMSGADQTWWSRPDLLALARARGVGVLHARASDWLAGGSGAPSAAALERAETLARTGDVALLGPRAGEARLSLALDEQTGMAAFALEQNGRRALVMGGERREERAVGAAGLAGGARTAVAAERAR